MKLGSLMGFLVVHHARTASRPNWLPGACFHYEPFWHEAPRYDARTGLPRKRSFVVVRIMAKDRRLVTGHCPIMPVDQPDEVVCRRLKYRLWHDGLLAVSNYLTKSDRQKFGTLTLEAPAMPWL